MINYILPKRIRKKIVSQRPVVWLLNIIFLLSIFFTLHFILFKIAEKVTWLESLWQTWQTFTTVGYGNHPAATLNGMLVTIFTSTVGIALLGILFSAIVELNLWNKERRKFGFMKNKAKHGYIVINFPGESTFFDLINEIRFIEEDVPICVVDGRIKELPQTIEILKNVHFVTGSIYDKETYNSANIKQNKTIIVFPVEPYKSDSDGTTRTIVEAVTRFVGESTRVLHVLVDPRNSWMFDNSSSTQVLENLEVFALVQECQDVHSSKIIENLLSNRTGANPKTVHPEKIIGWTWEEFLVCSLTASKNLDLHVNPFAIVKDGEPNSCPAFDQVIEKSDLISMITHKPISWTVFENELVKCKVRK